MQQKEIPYRDVCDLIFKSDLLPAVYRWVSNLSPESLLRFAKVFFRIVNLLTNPSDGTEFESSPPSSSPEPFSFHTPTPASLTPELLLTRPTSSHLTYGAFDADQMRTCRGVPTRTRETDKSHIHTAEHCERNVNHWTERAMSTTYRRDICRTANERTVRDVTPEQKVFVYSKGTLNSEAVSVLSQFIEKDPIWTREFREICRSLSESINSTAYRNCFIEKKGVPTTQHRKPKWTDPVPISKGLPKPAETFWQTSNRADFKPIARVEEKYKISEQIQVRPFDLHPGVEKLGTTMRDAIKDHSADREQHPEYFGDGKMKIGSASAVAGKIVGRQV